MFIVIIMIGTFGGSYFYDSYLDPLLFEEDRETVSVEI